MSQHRTAGCIWPICAGTDEAARLAGPTQWPWAPPCRSLASLIPPGRHLHPHYPSQPLPRAELTAAGQEQEGQAKPCPPAQRDHHPASPPNEGPGRTGLLGDSPTIQMWSCPTRPTEKRLLLAWRVSVFTGAAGNRSARVSPSLAGRQGNLHVHEVLGAASQACEGEAASPVRTQGAGGRPL